MDEQNRNLLLATGLSFLVILIWFALFPPPEPVEAPATETAQTQGNDGVTAAPAPSGDGALPATPGVVGATLTTQWLNLVPGALATSNSAEIVLGQ